MQPQSLWVGVDPRPPHARILALASSGETLLKAYLRSKPCHPRALATLLEALALWQGVSAHGVLAVGEEEPWCDAALYRVGFDDFGSTPLYSIELATALARDKKKWRRPDKISGMGDFRDLRQMKMSG